MQKIFQIEENRYLSISLPNWIPCHKKIKQFNPPLLWITSYYKRSNVFDLVSNFREDRWIEYLCDFYSPGAQKVRQIWLLSVFIK